MIGRATSEVREGSLDHTEQPVDREIDAMDGSRRGRRDDPAPVDGHVDAHLHAVDDAFHPEAIRHDVGVDPALASRARVVGSDDIGIGAAPADDCRHHEGDGTQPA